MSEAVTERRLAAIILGDVVGYSRLMGIDEVATMAALKAHQQELVLPVLAAFRGRLVDAAGDAMLIELGSAVAAVSCAVAIQRGMLARNAGVPAERQLRFRLGLNLGDIVVDGDKIYGDGINVAARLESLCEPGGLCISRSIQEQIRGRLPFPFVDAGEQTLKNIAHPVQIFRLPAEFIATLPEPVLPAVPPALTVTLPILKPGTVLNDTYQIDTPIGSGGMGEIFRGHEIHSGGGVAIKVIRPDMMDNKIAAALFQKEALVLKDITHDAIVRYYSFSFDPTLRRHYLAMEFVDGPPLPELLKEGPLSFEAVAALRRRVAAGLHLAHGRGIVHRDIASDNIIVPARDVSRAKVIDFGIARAAALGAETIIGDGFAGKYNYVAPEQLGLAGGEVSALSDIYSFGLVLAEVSLGQALDMGGTQAEVLDKRHTVPNLGAVDPRLRPLLERMLQPDPARRPQSMQEVADWSYAEHPRETPSRPMPRPEPVRAAEPVRLPRTAPPKPSAERWIIGGALALILIAGAGVGVYEWLIPRERPRPAASAVPTEALATADTPKPAEPAQAPTTPPHSEPTNAPVPDDVAPANPLPPTGPVSPPPKAPRTPADRIADYIKAYDGGGCFLALPVRVTDTAAAIDGFAQAKEAFQTFDAAFTRDLGVSPDIVGNRVWSKQCPAVDFLRQAGTGTGASPTLFVKSTSVARGQTLAGSVRAAGKALALLLVQEDGSVVDLSKSLKDDGDSKTFDVPVSHDPGSGRLPQMLVTVASARPLDALSQDGPQPADRLFPAMTDEARSRGETLAASAKLFLLTP